MVIVIYLLIGWIVCGGIAHLLRPDPSKVLPRFLCGPVALYVELVEAYVNMMMDDDDFDAPRMG